MESILPTMGLKKGWRCAINFGIKTFERLARRFNPHDCITDNQGCQIFKQIFTGLGHSKLALFWRALCEIPKLHTNALAPISPNVYMNLNLVKLSCSYMLRNDLTRQQFCSSPDHTIDKPPKSHNSLDKYPTRHNFVKEMCMHVHISVT